MGMTISNLCDSCTNIGCEFQSGIVRTECAFYMQPTVDAIPKADYEARLKADMVAMLTEIQLEIEEMSGLCTEIHGDEWNEINTVHSQDVLSLIQQKINALEAEIEPQESEAADGNEAI